MRSAGLEALGKFFTLTNETFEVFGFAEPLSRALTQCGYATPTPIQVQALPPQLEGRDLLGMAETGSGKTATFLLPILNKIAVNAIEPGYKQVVALILAPTRELAIQIDQEVAKLSRNMNIRRAVVLGGVSKGPQIGALKRGVHILVATPGRLLDHVNMRSCDLSGVQTLVIDEADRMFDMGFIRDIRKIVSLIPQKRRTALFSATMPDEIKKFAYDILHDPYRVDLSSKKIVVDRIDQKIMIVRTPEKQSRLHTLLADDATKRVIVFTRTKRGADRVAGRLGMAGISAAAFHGNKAQNARQRALNDFTLGHIRVLVATDIAARGIDVSNITHVINFDMPLDPETYVHRVGRTARKGTNGVAISLCDPSERQEVRAIERMMKQPIEVIDDVGGEAVPALPRDHRRHDGEDVRRDRHRAGDARSERHAGQRRTNAPRGTDRRDQGPRHPAEGRGQAPSESAHHIDGAAMFGVTDRDQSSRQDRRHRDNHRPREQRADQSRPNANRLDDRHPPSGHHRPKDHRGEHRSTGTEAGREQHRHGNRQAEGRRGESRSSWSSGDAPKFMKRRDDDRNRVRPAR